MSTEALSSFPPRQRIALVDLVATESADASRVFVAQATRHATEVGGRRVIANETLVPMTIPDPESTRLDEATRLLLVRKEDAGSGLSQHGVAVLFEPVGASALPRVGGLDRHFRWLQPLSIEGRLDPCPGVRAVSRGASEAPRAPLRVPSAADSSR